MKLFKISLGLQMAIATCLGILCGLVFGDLCHVFAPYTSAYIMILKITAVPYLIGSIIYGVGQLTPSQAKLILKHGIFFILIAWSINIAMIYVTYGLFPKSQTSCPSGYIAGNTPPLNIADLLIPENIFYDLSNNIVPSIVIFTLLVSIALMYLKDKQPFVQGFQILIEALTRVTSWIARITPVGTFLIIANQAGTVQFSTVKQVSAYIILYILCVSLITFWIFPKLTGLLCHIPARQWLQQMFPILLLAYTTNMVIICLPYIIELLKKETSTLDPYDEKAQKQIQGTVSVVFNLPMGSLFITLFVLFISLLYAVPLNFGSHLELFFTSFLTSLGAVGMGSWVNSLTFMLSSLGLPQEAVSLYLSTLPFTSGFQAMISSMQIASLSLLIILATRKRIQWKIIKLLRGLVPLVIPVLILLGTLKLYNPLPEIRNSKKSIFELSISSDAPAIISPQPSLPLKQQEDTLQRILRTKTLRVGYATTTTPFAFYNLQQQVVGFDMAFAYELAYDLGCQLILVPMSYALITQEIENGFYDIAMSAVSITEERLKYLSFTSPYLQPSFVFVTKNVHKNTFSSLQRVQDNPTLTLAVLKGTSYEKLARDLFPHHKLFLLENPDQFAALPNIDALFWTEDQATAWALRHHHFRVISPSPSMGKDSLAYATNQHSPDFVNYLNQWLALKSLQGFSDRQYNLWILGKTEMVTTPPPRWSLLRHLGWVD
ncbi:MAG: cation:dicarboxylase symporter family transporter [Chlamydiae bacterium]|nr:cation:dicarboxylase symporter family transporter [Chlamydiota bacterium]